MKEVQLHYLRSEPILSSEWQCSFLSYSSLHNHTVTPYHVTGHSPQSDSFGATFLQHPCLWNSCTVLSGLQCWGIPYTLRWLVTIQPGLDQWTSVLGLTRSHQWHHGTDLEAVIGPRVKEVWFYFGWIWRAAEFSKLCHTMDTFPVSTTVVICFVCKIYSRCENFSGYLLQLLTIPWMQVDSNYHQLQAATVASWQRPNQHSRRKLSPGLYLHQNHQCCLEPVRTKSNCYRRTDFYTENGNINGWM